MRNFTFVILFFLLSSCASQPETPQGRFDKRMSEIDHDYGVSDPNRAAMLRSITFQEREAKIERERTSPRDRVLRTTAIKTECPSLRPKFALEKTTCSTVYRYEIWIQLSCQNPRLKVKPDTIVHWNIAGEEGTVGVSRTESVNIQLDKIRTTKAVGDPPVEDGDVPRSFELGIGEMVVKIPSDGSTKGTLLVKNSLCDEIIQ